MNESETTLQNRISQFSIDHGDEELTFAARLGRENGWTPAFTVRVIAEYKRFLFLAVVADHPVTPSDPVDQAWHLHLTYTRSYWDRLCGEVLERPLHHGPTRGGQAESTKYADQYGRTLASYQSYFGEKPPADIWPSAAERFGADVHFQRVNTMRNWLIPVPRVLAGIRTKAFVIFATGLGSAAMIALMSSLLGSGERITWQEGDLGTLNAHVTENSIPVILSGIMGLDDLELVFLCLIPVIAYCVLQGLPPRCPRCEEKPALEPTGEVQVRTWRWDLWEWKCRDCGFTRWRKKPMPGESNGCGRG